jgi:hypothetical protein
VTAASALALLRLNPTVHPSVRKTENLPNSPKEKLINQSAFDLLFLGSALSTQVRTKNSNTYGRNLLHGLVTEHIVKHFSLSAVTTPCNDLSFAMGMSCRYPGVKNIGLE